MEEIRLPRRLVFSKDIHEFTGFSLRWIAQLEQKGLFPKRIQLGGRRIAGDAQAIAAWQDGKWPPPDDTQKTDQINISSYR